MSNAQLPGFMIVLFISPFHIYLNNGMTKKPVKYFDTVMYVDPMTSQTFEYANQIPCENNPQNVSALDTDRDQ